jgi:hypothetical protein
MGVSPGSLFLEVCSPQVVLQRAMESVHQTDVTEQALQALVCASSPIAPSVQVSDFADSIQEIEASGRVSILCICGQIELEVDGQGYCLNPGDNLTLNSNAFH